MAGLRAGLGMAAIAAPALVGRPWYQRDAGRPVPKMLTRSMGARDVGLGLGAMLALDGGAPARRWVEAGTLADAADLIGTLVAYKSVSRLARVGIVGITSGLVGLGAVVAPSVD